MRSRQAPQQGVDGVKAHTGDWSYDAITIGIPSPVLRGQVTEEPWNLGTGWVGFDWQAALGRPVKIMIGGMTGWLDEGFRTESGPVPAAAACG